MEHTLFAVYELSGFIRAMALVRPSKSLDEVAPRSVRRKIKDKAFAKDVNDEDMQKWADKLGIDLDEHIMFIVESMKPISEQIDLPPWQTAKVTRIQLSDSDHGEPVEPPPLGGHSHQKHDLCESFDGLRRSGRRTPRGKQIPAP